MKAIDGMGTNGDKSGGQFSQSPELASGSRSNITDELLQEIDSLRTRLSKLSEASRRVSENLDLGVVLQEVIDNARSLTGARYGALLTYEQSGGIQDFITSGLSPEETERLNTLPQGLGLLGYMNEIREPLRLADIASHSSSVGFPENHPPMKTFLGMPIRHYGEHVGNIYLTEKEGGRDFTIEDQEVLVMFASQAGAAILNARRYRKERRARADLEALLTLSPVGMLVVDAATRTVNSVNKEARRIIGVEAGIELDQYRTKASYSRPDGRKLSTESHPLQIALNGKNTLGPEEVIFENADGQKVHCLINAAPIYSEQGELVSAVGTLLDITPLEEMKRQRTEFLSNVSHKMRTPLTAIKGSTSTLLDSGYPLEPAETRQFLRVIDEQSDHMRNLINDLVDMTQIEAGTLPVNPEPTEVADLLGAAREAHIHEEAENSSVELNLPGALPRVMADTRRILQVLRNLLADVSSYSSKSSTVRISALPTDLYVAVTVDSHDTGAAAPLPPRQIRRHSRAAADVAERRNGGGDLGIGICEGIVEAHGGRLSVEASGDGRGSGFTFTIPVVDEAALPSEQGLPQSPSARDPDGGRARILTISENTETGRYVRTTLSQAGFTAVVTDDPHKAEQLIELEKPHVVLLEPALPWNDGFEILVRVGRTCDAPVIFVAGHGWDQHIGRAFELGAIDYIAKPFTSTELLARVELALRRRSVAGWKEPSLPYLHGDLTIDYAEREVSVAGRPIHLTATEYKLLVELSAAAGRVSTHEQLLRRVWGPLYSSDSRILRTYIKELRHKLGDDAARPTHIFTEPGVGYHMPKPSNIR